MRRARAFAALGSVRSVARDLAAEVQLTITFVGWIAFLLVGWWGVDGKKTRVVGCVHATLLCVPASPPDRACWCWQSSVGNARGGDDSACSHKPRRLVYGAGSLRYFFDQRTERGRGEF